VVARGAGEKIHTFFRIERVPVFERAPVIICLPGVALVARGVELVVAGVISRRRRSGSWVSLEIARIYIARIYIFERGRRWCVRLWVFEGRGLAVLGFKVL
jgi:hypothetical protein